MLPDFNWNLFGRWQQERREHFYLRTHARTRTWAGPIESVTCRSGRSRMWIVAMPHSGWIPTRELDNERNGHFDPVKPVTYPADDWSSVCAIEMKLTEIIIYFNVRWWCGLPNYEFLFNTFVDRYVQSLILIKYPRWIAIWINYHWLKIYTFITHCPFAMVNSITHYSSAT